MYSLSRKNGGLVELHVVELGDVVAVAQRFAEQAEERQLALEAAQALGVEAELEDAVRASASRARASHTSPNPPSPSLRSSIHAGAAGDLQPDGRAPAER